MPITERQKDILRAIIREHIKDANPVGSKTLAEQYSFGIGPAMIRQEMAAIEGEGYITQPHTSAGRVPTDSAYRWYISEIEGKEEDSLSRVEQKRINEGIRAQREWRAMLKNLSRVMADVSGELSVSGLTSGDVRYAHGFSQLAKEPEMGDPERTQNLLHFMDEMDSYFDTLWQNALEDSFGVFIGKENPVKEVQSFSIITGKYSLSNGQAGFISIIGPRRMDYRKNVAIVRYVTHQLDS